MTLSKQQLETLQHVIEQRCLALTDELHGDAARLREETYAELAGPVTDPADEAAADVLADVSNAELTRDLEELRELEQARARLATGDFGTCPDCGDGIPFGRLSVQPAALRCVGCQRLHEKTFAHGDKPKL